MNRELTIDLNVDLSSLPSIIGDPQRLQQVFWNLLSNAIKFTPDGGSISVKGWVVDTPPAGSGKMGQPSAHPSNEGAEGGVVVAVVDSGIGIDPDDQTEIFNRFYIAGSTNYHTSSKTAFRGGGLGLGLSITGGIVQAHNGRIWVESPGYDAKNTPGSTFYVYLPFGDLHPARKA